MLTGNVRVMSAAALGLGSNSTQSSDSSATVLPADLESWKDGVEVTLGAQHDSITVMGGEISSLKSAVTNISAYGYDDRALKSSITANATDIQSLKGSVTVLGGRMDALESLNFGEYGSVLSGLSSAGTWGSDISSLKNSVTVLGSSVRSALSIASGASSMSQAVSRNQTAAAASIAALNTLTSNITVSVDGAIGDIQSIAGNVSGIQDSVTVLGGRFDTLETLVESLESSVSNGITISSSNNSTISYNDTALVNSIRSAASVATGAASSIKSLATVVSGQGTVLGAATVSIGNTYDRVTLVGSQLENATVSIGGNTSSIKSLNSVVSGLSNKVTAMGSQVANFVNIPVPFVYVTGTNYTIGNLGAAINTAIVREVGSYIVGNYHLKFEMLVDNSRYCFTGSWRVFNNGNGKVSAGIFTAVPTNISAITADASRVYLITRGDNASGVTMEKIFPFDSSLVGLPISQAQVMRVFFSALKEVSPSNGATGVNLINIGLAAAAESSGLDTWEKLKNSFCNKHRDYMTQGKSVETFLSEVCGIDLTNEDTGSIIGKDAGGDVTYDAQDIVKEDESLPVGQGIELIFDLSQIIQSNESMLEDFPENSFLERKFSGLVVEDSDTGKSIIFGYWSDLPAYNPYTKQKSTLGEKELWLTKLIISHMIKPSLQLIKDAYGLDLINDNGINHFILPSGILSPDGTRKLYYLGVNTPVVPVHLSTSPHYTGHVDPTVLPNSGIVAFTMSGTSPNRTYADNGYRCNACEVVVNSHQFFKEDSIVKDDLNGVTRILENDTTGFYLDRTLAHELFHMVEYTCIPRWSEGSIPHCLNEGLPELLHGIDDARNKLISELVSDIPDSSGDCRLKAAVNAERSDYDPGGKYAAKTDHNRKRYSADDPYVAGVLILRYFCKAAAESRNGKSR